MNQHEAPHGMVATLGHPANKILIVKTSGDLWRYVETGKPVDDEDFRAGWDDYAPTESIAKLNADLELLQELVASTDLRARYWWRRYQAAIGLPYHPEPDEIEYEAAKLGRPS